jgi:hypothetical protein
LAAYSLTGRSRSHAGGDRRAARLPQLERGHRVVGQEDLFDRHLVRRELFDQRPQAIQQQAQAQREGLGIQQLDRLVVHVHDLARGIHVDDAHAGPL